MIFLLEFIISFFVIWGLYYLSIYLFSKKFNKITSIVFSFISIGLLVFLISPYLISFSYPAWIYLPSSIFWFVFYLYKNTKTNL